MSSQRTARLRYFISTQNCRYHRNLSNPSWRNHIHSQGTAHTQSTVVAHNLDTLAAHRQRIASRISPYFSPQPIKASLSSQLLTRRFATAATDVAEPGTSRTAALLVVAPKPEEMGPGDDDVELLSPDEARLNITERAAEKLRAISTSENDASLALRISVESGGCHGYQYKMELTSQRGKDDYQFTHPTHRPGSIVVDAVSLGLLKGSTVDYATELIGSSFSIIDNPQAKGSGCGCGISWEAKL